MVIRENALIKIAYGSDIHLEFGNVEKTKIKNTENADILILAGDICLARKIKSGEYDKFFAQISFEFPEILYIAGNHEHYRFKLSETHDTLREALVRYPSIHILDQETFHFRTYAFHCATLWTDMNKRDPNVLYQVGQGMNDFHIIEGKNDMIFSTENAAEIHERTLEFLRLSIMAEAGEGFKSIVVSHHAPSFQSVEDRFRGSVLNYGYASDILETFAERHKNLKLWIHGHMHAEVDYKDLTGHVRVVANPRGYIGREKIANKWKLKYITLE